MKAKYEYRLGSVWSPVLNLHHGLILYLVGLFGWVVTVPLYGDTMTVWASQHGISILLLSNCFLIAHAVSLILTGMNLDHRPHRAVTIARLVPLGNALLLLLILFVPTWAWTSLFALMGIVTAFGMTVWGRWYATTVKTEWLGKTFALAAAGVAAFHGTFGVLVTYVPPASLLPLSLLPLALASLAIQKQKQPILPTVPSLPAQTRPLAERIRSGIRFGLFVCFFSVVAGLSDRFFVALPISPLVQDFLRMAPYIVGVLLSGIIADLSGLLWIMVVGAAVLAVSFLIGAWSSRPLITLLGLLFNGLAFGLLEPAPWLLLASSCTEATAGRWFGWGLNLNVIPIFIGTVIAIPLGHITASHLGLLASFFILLAILFLHGTRDPLAALRRQYQDSPNHPIDGTDIFTIKQFDLAFGGILSEREKEVGELAITGKSNQEIAELLFISENTVKFHLKNVFRKTGCANRNDLYREIVRGKQQ